MNLHDLLKDDLTQTLITEFGIENESDDVKARLIAKFGENILGRVVLEMLNTLPADKRAGFDTLVGSGDPDALKAYLSPYIPDLDRFLHEETRKETDRIKLHMRDQA